MSYPLPPSNLDPLLIQYLQRLVQSLESRDSQTFFGSANKGGTSSWTLTSVSINRAFNPSTATLSETANALGTLLQDFKNKGIIA